MTEKSSHTSYTPFLWLCAVLVATFAGWWLFLEQFLPSTEVLEYSDIFGSFSAIMSALAFGGLIYTFLLQRRELQLQREELEATRGELAGQREQLSLQTQALHDQSFENTFFQLVNLHHRIVEGIRIGQPGYDQRGRDAFESMYEELRHHLLHMGTKHSPAVTQTEIRERYQPFREQYGSQTEHYFKNLYYIFSFIDGSSIQNKIRYVLFMGAQLSHPEMLLLFYNCLAYEGGNFPMLIERYSLFHNLPVGRLIHKSHRVLYEEGSYDFQPGSRV